MILQKSRTSRRKTALGLAVFILGTAGQHRRESDVPAGPDVGRVEVGRGGVGPGGGDGVRHEAGVRGLVTDAPVFVSLPFRLDNIHLSDASADSTPCLAAQKI